MVDDNGAKMYDVDDTTAIPTAMFFEIGHVPHDNDKKTLDRGTSQTWKDLLQSIREECVNAPGFTMGFIFHAMNGTIKKSRFLYNAIFMEILQAGKIDLNTEVHLRFAGASNSKRKPRSATLAKHGTASRKDANIFTYVIDDLTTGELNWGFQHPVLGKDQTRVQNLDGLRESDILDNGNMTQGERAELFSIQFYEKLVTNLLTVPLSYDKFLQAQANRRWVAPTGDEDDDEDEDDDAAGEDADESPTKKQRTTPVKEISRTSAKAENPSSTGSGGIGGPSTGAPRKAPLLCVYLGAGNGNSVLGFLQASMLAKRSHLLILEPGRTHAEFAQRRASEMVYEAWFQRKLVHKHRPVVLADLMNEASLTPFDPTPLALSPGEGRLMIPDRLFRKFEHNEWTSALVDEFKAKHYDAFAQGNVTMATVRACLMGAGKETVTSSTHVKAELAPAANDPLTDAALEAAKPVVACVGYTGKHKIHVTQDEKVFVNVQAQHGVLAGQRIFLYGSGKFHTKDEVTSLSGRVVLWPELKSDEQMVIFIDSSAKPPKETYQSMYATITHLRSKGLLKEPLIIPFHTVAYEAAANGSRERWTFTPTRDRAWVPNRGFDGEAGKKLTDDVAKSVICTNIGAYIGTTFESNTIAEAPRCRARVPGVARTLRAASDAIVLGAPEFRTYKQPPTITQQQRCPPWK